MALHYAGGLDARSSIRLARQRGLAMAQAAKNVAGAMLAIFAPLEAVEAYLSAQRSSLVLANDNAPGQVIISGTLSDIARAQSELSDLGHRVRRLSVSTAFHSPLVADAVGDLRKAIDDIGLGMPEMTVYANATAAPYPETQVSVRDLLARQLASPVRFREMIERMYDDGVRTFVELGPASVLTGLVDTILDRRPHLAVSLDDKRGHGVAAFNRALGRLAVAGHDIDFTGLWREAPAPERRADIKKHELMLDGANYFRNRHSEQLALDRRTIQVPTEPALPDTESPAPASPVVEARNTATEPEAPQSPETATAKPEPVGAQAELHIEQIVDEVDMNPEALREIRQLQDTLATKHRRFVDAMTSAHVAFLETSKALIERTQPDLGTPAEKKAWATEPRPCPLRKLPIPAWHNRRPSRRGRHRNPPRSGPPDHSPTQRPR